MLGYLVGGRGGAPPDEAALDGVCDTVIEQLRPAVGSSESDDLALLAARLGSLPPDRVATWTFPAAPAMLPAIGGTVDHRLRGWGLGALAERAGRLVDRLARDAMAGEDRSVAVRMVYGASLMVEVTAPLPEPGYRDGAEQLLTAHQARRWGTRHGPIGHAVWFELPLPESWGLT
ncbi:hypothetical protein [Streptomyces sp. NPDC127098]|uniref:hypothetical protein n=1 Tax=Streptomyces sp. NPDC127098 TaxID=3347137 RepID=UPI00365A02F3